VAWNAQRDKVFHVLPEQADVRHVVDVQDSGGFTARVTAFAVVLEYLAALDLPALGLDVVAISLCYDDKSP
jgi:hypothetical protein